MCGPHIIYGSHVIFNVPTSYNCKIEKQKNYDLFRGHNGFTGGFKLEKVDVDSYICIPVLTE